MRQVIYRSQLFNIEDESISGKHALAVFFQILFAKISLTRLKAVKVGAIELLECTNQRLNALFCVCLAFT